MNVRNRWVLLPLLSLGFLVFIAAGGALVQQLWNWLLPAIFGVREVTFWQALGLLALCRILFGGFGRGGGPHSSSSRRRGEWWKTRGDRFRQRPSEESVTSTSASSVNEAAASTQPNAG